MDATPEAEKIHRKLGFSLNIVQSSITDAGQGVFLKGHAHRGTIVALYPGTVYEPGEPLFFASLRNAYVLRCFDGLFVDGKSSGLSRSIYRSLISMHTHGGLLGPIADARWLDISSQLGRQSCLNIGQKINNGSSKLPPNVEYQELDVPSDFNPRLKKWLPNVHYSSHWSPDRDKTRIVLLVTTKDVENEELFSSYHETLPR